MKEYKSQQHHIRRELVLNDGYTIETEAKGKSESTDYSPLTYLAYFRLLHPTLLSGDEKGHIMRLRSSGGQNPADIHSTSDRTLRSWDPQALQQTAGVLVLMSL
jgi:hypothetical protein